MMKKMTKAVISIFLMGAVLVGCAAPTQAPPVAPPAAAAVPAPEAPAEPEVQIEERSAVEEFLYEYGDDIREEFGELAGLLGEGARIDIAAGDGEEFIFIFAFGSEEDTDVFAEALGTIMPLMGSIFDVFAAQLQEELGVDKLTITVRYEDYEGIVIAEESFVAL